MISWISSFSVPFFVLSFQRTGVLSGDRIARASSRIAVGEAIVSRQPLFPQEHGLPPRVMTGICPISAHCSLTPCQIFPSMERAAPMPYSQRRKNCAPLVLSFARNICAANSALTLFAITARKPVSSSKRWQSGNFPSLSAPKLSVTYRPSAEQIPRTAIPRPTAFSLFNPFSSVRSSSREARSCTVSSGGA